MPAHQRWMRNIAAKRASHGLNRVLGINSVNDLEEAYGWMKGKSGNRFFR